MSLIQKVGGLAKGVVPGAKLHLEEGLHGAPDLMHLRLVELLLEDPHEDAPSINTTEGLGGRVLEVLCGLALQRRAQAQTNLALVDDLAGDLNVGVDLANPDLEALGIGLTVAVEDRSWWKVSTWSLLGPGFS